MKKLFQFAAVSFILANNPLAAQCSATITPFGSPTGCGNRTLTASPVGDTWTQKASMNGYRTNAAGFSIGNKGYIGTGSTSGSNYTNDFWEYDLATDSWSQRATYPGAARTAAVGFSIGNKGYIGTGVDVNNLRHSDFYEYDPAANTWIVRASITGARSFATAFSIGSKGYVGTGYSSNAYVNDFWEYDPATNVWTARTSFGGTGRHSATGLSIGTKGYIGFGSTGSVGTNDFWEYDPATNLWNQKAGIYGLQMYAACGFGLGNKGYLACGKDQGTSNNFSSKTYQYDPVTNLWREVAPNPPNAKYYSVAFTIGGKGYVGTGSSTNVLFEYEPAASYAWSTGATTSSVSVGGTGTYSVLITTAAGCTASASQAIATAPNPTLSVSGGSLVCAASNSTLNVSGASSYTWSANAGGGNATSVIVAPTISTAYTVSGTTGSCTVSYPVAVFVSGIPVGNISVSGPTVGCGVRTLSVNPGGDAWTQKASMSIGHNRPIAFSIGSKGYLGTGADGGNGNNNDFWEYDPIADTWTQRANFGGGLRFGAFSFSIGNKGYAGGGYSNTSIFDGQVDFWEYDPITNAWARKGDLPMIPRSLQVSFTIGNKGYMGTGQDGYGNTAYTDFWEYNPLTDLWVQKADVPSVGRAGSAGFGIGTKGYLGTGYPAYPSTTPLGDFWEFDPLANTWTAIAAFPGGIGGDGVGFTIGNRGYITGNNFTANVAGLWEYNPVANTWTARADFPGPARTWAIAFTIGNKGYMGSGANGYSLISHKDLWQYDPAASFAWSTGAITSSIVAPVSGSYSVTINTITGCSVTAVQALSLSPNPTISISGNPNNLCGGLSATLTASGAGSYTWSGNAGGGNATSVIVTPTSSTIYTVSGTTGTCTVNNPVTIKLLPVPSTIIAASGPTLGCGTLTLSVNASPVGWTQKTSITLARWQSVAFSIGSKGYAGLGQTNSTTLSDFWEYDPQANAWTQKASFTAGPRYNATGFSIGTKGYVAAGYDNSSSPRNDFWEFDPIANTWTQKLSLGTARATATGFGLNGKGYVGLGDGPSTTLKDFWEYDPANNTWTQKADYAGGVRSGAASFTIGLKGYVGTGYGPTSTMSDFWEFDPIANTWTSKAAYSGGPTNNTTGFGINTKGYFNTGSNIANTNGTINALWEYDATLNTWTQKPGLPGARTGHMSFAIGNKGYTGTGININAAPYFFNDVWEFDPGSAISWSTGSTLQAIPVTTSGNYSVSIINSYGCSAASSQSVALSPNPTITVSGIPALLCAGVSSTLSASGAGSYSWSSNSGGGTNASVVVSPTITTSYTLSGTTGSCTVNYPLTIPVSTPPVATMAINGPTVSCGTLSLSVNTITNSWTQKTGLTVGRSQGVAFSIGNKGYVGLGLNPGYLADFWEYDPATNAWTQRAGFAGGARSGATGFCIGNKGYVGMGYNSSGNSYKNDLWEFDPAANTWIQKASLPTVGRQNVTGFALNGKGYIGLGTYSAGTAVGDFWEYDPMFDSWSPKANFVSNRTKAVVFTIGSLAYVGGGYTNTSYMNDLWAFDPVANTWTAKASFGFTGVQLASAFSIGTKGYIGLGSTGSSDLNTFWEYNSITNTWIQKSNFSGTARQGAGAFAIGNKGYIAMGYNSASSPNYKTDLWEYQDINTINWSTGSTLQAISVAASGVYSVTLTSSEGCSASSVQSVSLSPNPTISVSGYTSALCNGGSASLAVSGAGTYTWSANAGGGNGTSVVVTPTASTIYMVSGTTGSCTVDYPVYVGSMAIPVATIIPVGSTTICGAAITLSTTTGVSNIWTQKAAITTSRNYAAGFSVNGKGYVGTGLSGGNSLSDFWEYDPANNIWSQKAGFGGGARYGAVGLSIGNKGYVGTGFDGTANAYKNDFWEYDPAANTWAQKASFGGSLRRQAAAFSIGNKGYVGTGWDGASYKNDLWEYDPATDLWLQKASISVARYGAAGVSLGTKGYIGGGQLISGSATTEFWEYDPAANTWTARANIGTFNRVGAVSFALGNRLILTGGNSVNDTYEYNPALNTWTTRVNFGGVYRSNAVGFAINGKGYVATGSGSSVYSDLWEYSPTVDIQWSTGATTPTISATSTGTYGLTLSTIFGCAGSTSQAVSITPMPTVSIGGNAAVCNGSSTTLTASGAANYTWSANAGSATTSTLTIAPTVNTSYTVTGATNGCTASAVKEVTVNAVPVVTGSTNINSVCQGFSITLSGGGASTYTWTSGAVNNTPFIPATTTDYTVTGASNNCTNSAVVSVTVKPSPTVTVNSGTICAGQSFTMSPNGALSYTYSNGTNVVTPGTTASYSVTGSNAIGCTNALPAISTVTVNALPAINAASGVVCAGSSYTITPSGAATYTYSSGSNVVTPANTSTYGVSGTSTAGCVSANPTVVTVTVSALPTVSVSSGTVCNGQSFTLTPSGAVTYTYLPGGSAIVTPATNTSYSVTGANANGCVSPAAAIANVAVLVSPTVSVNSGSICAGQAFTLNPAGANTYTYSGGSAIITPASTTIYTVTGFNPNGCFNAALVTSTVTVHALPVITANSGVMCAGSAYTIVPSGAATYTYSGGSDIVTPATTSTYAVAGTSSVGCVSASPAIITVTVSALPTLTVNSGTLCTGQSFTLTPSGATAYTVTPGGATVVSPNATTAYSVTGVNAFGCLSAAQAVSQVTVFTTPTLSLLSGTVICPGDSYTIDPAGADSYTYSGGSVVTPASTTVYTITGASTQGCYATAALLTVTVQSTLIVNISGPATTCQGQAVTLSANGANTYTWNNGTVGSSVSVTPVTGTTYSVNAGTGNCSASATHFVGVNPAPSLSVANSTSLVCNGETASLTASGAPQYTWNDTSTDAVLVISPTVTTTYTLSGAFANGCSSSVTVTQDVTDCTGITGAGKSANPMIRVYPNPNSGFVTIASESFPANATVELYNYIGQLIVSQKVTADTLHLNFENNANGIYTLRVIAGNTPVFVTKVVKE